MASLALRLVAPDDENLTTLYIYEAATSTGPFAEIEVVSDIGIYPNYITEYTTRNANDGSDWFSVQWGDDKGARTPLSVPIKGGVETLVSEVVSRARQRIPKLSVQVVTQEVEAAIQAWAGDNADPYDPTLTANYRQKNGLTYMAIARMMMADLLMSSLVESATIGLISFKTATGSSALKNIQELTDLAERDLGISGSHVLDMDRICRVYGGPDWRVLRQLLYNDQEIAYTPWKPWPIERPRSGTLRSFR